MRCCARARDRINPLQPFRKPQAGKSVAASGRVDSAWSSSRTEMLQAPTAMSARQTKCPGRSKRHQEALATQRCQYICSPHRYAARLSPLSRQSREFDLIHLQDVGTGNHPSPVGRPARKAGGIPSATQQMTVNVHVNESVEFTPVALQGGNSDISTRYVIDQRDLNRDRAAQRPVRNCRNNVLQFLATLIWADVTHLAEIAGTRQGKQRGGVNMREA